MYGSCAWYAPVNSGLSLGSFGMFRVILPIATHVSEPTKVWVNVGRKIKVPIMIHCLGIIDIAKILEECRTSMSNPDTYFTILLVMDHVFKAHVFCTTSVQACRRIKSMLIVCIV